MRLPLIAKHLAESVRQLGVQLEPERVHVVAHSMGGLVAREFINQNVAEKKKELVQSFISISTPFNGHQAAVSGIKYSPVVAPAWHDVVPNSPFIRRMYASPLPDYVEHHLLFGFHGDGDDGVISLESMLDERAQAGAFAKHGFDEDHTSILRSPAVIDHVMQALVEADEPLCQ